MVEDPERQKRRLNLRKEEDKLKKAMDSLMTVEDDVDMADMADLTDMADCPC